MEFALDATGWLVRADTARPRGVYTCVACQVPVAPVRGARRPRFRHLPRSPGERRRAATCTYFIPVWEQEEASAAVEPTAPPPDPNARAGAAAAADPGPSLQARLRWLRLVRWAASVNRGSRIADRGSIGLAILDPRSSILDPRTRSSAPSVVGLLETCRWPAAFLPQVRSAARELLRRL
jgi:hypothetical protein